MNNLYEEWGLSLQEHQGGNYGSSFNSFRVPAQFKKYYTINGVYDSQKAHQEIANLFINAIVHRYQDIFSEMSLMQKGMFIGQSLDTYIADAPSHIDLQLEDSILAKYLSPQIGDKIFIDNNLTYTIGEVIQLGETKGNTIRIKPVPNLMQKILKGTRIYIEGQDVFILMKHTRDNVKKAIYKGIDHVSINREIWQILKDNSFSGSKFSFSSQTSTRILSNDIFGADANNLLENAELNKYKVKDNGKGNKTLYYKDKIIYTGSNFDFVNEAITFDNLEANMVRQAKDKYE